MGFPLPGPPPPPPQPPQPKIVVVLINPTGIPLDFVFTSLTGGANITKNVKDGTSIYYSYDPTLYVLDPNSAPGGYWMNI